MSASVERLKAARELIARRGGWTQKAAARDANGEWVTAWDRKATCYCMLGAIWAQTAGPASCTSREEECLSTITGISIDEFNDDPDRTQAQVVAAFDRAIAIAEAEARS